MIYYKQIQKYKEKTLSLYIIEYSLIYKENITYLYSTDKKKIISFFFFLSWTQLTKVNQS